YRVVVEKFSKDDRRSAATALLRMAGCYQKLGDALADVAYQRVVTNLHGGSSCDDRASIYVHAGSNRDALRKFEYHAGFRLETGAALAEEPRIHERSQP
ncbi:MAG: hypothetical protein AAGC63_15890, partial [Propionicimonas sp.]